MAKKVKHEEHENHERWLVSYADFITLLFAFFVVLYSISRVDNKRMAQVQQSIKFALHFKGTGGIDQLPLFEGPPVDGGKCRKERGFDEHPKTKQREEAEKARKRMEKKLKTFLQLRPQPQVVQIETERDGERGETREPSGSESRRMGSGTAGPTHVAPNSDRIRTMSSWHKTQMSKK